MPSSAASLGFTRKSKRRRRRHTAARSSAPLYDSAHNEREAPRRRLARSVSPQRRRPEPPMLVSRPQLRSGLLRDRRGRKRHRSLRLEAEVEAKVEDTDENEGTFWPVVSNTKNLDVMIDVPWRWFTVKGVVFVRGSLKLSFDSAQHKLGVGAFDIEALPLRAARFNGYRQMQAFLSGFVRNASKNYSLYGVPHGKTRSIRCYFDVDHDLLNSGSHHPIAMIGGHYDV